MSLHKQHVDIRRVTAAVALLAAIVEGAEDAIVAENLEGVIISWNPAAERLFGYSEAEAVGMHVSSLIPPHREGEWKQLLDEVLAGHRVRHFETQRQAKDGRTLDVSVSLSPLRSLNGELVGATKIVRDVSEMIQAREAKAQLAAIVESSDDAIISKDRKGRIRSWNRAAERLFGYTPEEVIGQPVTMLFPDDLVGTERDILSEILAGRKVDHYETRRVTKDGRELNVSLTVSPLYGRDGMVVGASKIVRNVTEERRLRADRERYATELADVRARLAAEQLKDQFLAMASHELRTPLTAISGFTRTLLDLGDRLSPEQHREFLEIMDRQSTRLTRLVDDLLTLSRIEADKLDSRPTRLDVSLAVKQLLREERIEEVEVAGAEHATAWADPHHLQQIVSNFVANARKYGKPPFRVVVEPDGDQVVVRVCDHGDGVPADQVSQLFERFARAEHHVQAQIPGTGLGLSIVRGLARAQGGEAWYEPNEPTGSQFCVRLPVAR